MSERLVVEKRGAIGWITFNQPEKRNAVSVDMWEAIPAALESFAADAEVRVVALRGAGDKAFVSGADISQFDKQRSGAAAVRHYDEIAERAQSMLYAFDKPTVAVIRGYCLGAGLNIALCCDLRIAADDARLGIPAARMGLGYRATSTKNLVDTVGAANTREILITARQYAADEAKAIGLVHRVVPAAGLVDAAQELLAEIAANAPLTMASAKFIVRELLKAHAGFDAAACAATVKRCFDSADYREGRTAFMAKRRPVFRGE
ncbi:MAG: enoyl-CoA hydratase [Burkholderiales bacterium]